MKRFAIYLYRNVRGDEVIENKLDLIRAREPLAWTPIRVGLEMLAQYGASAGTNKFTRLRYVEGGELWELRAQGKPAYRILFAPVPSEDAYVILHIVRKDDMSKESKRHTDRALEHLDHWLKEVRGHDAQQDI